MHAYGSAGLQVWEGKPFLSLSSCSSLNRGSLCLPASLGASVYIIFTPLLALYIALNFKGPFLPAWLAVGADYKERLLSVEERRGATLVGR